MVPGGDTGLLAASQVCGSRQHKCQWRGRATLWLCHDIMADALHPLRHSIACSLTALPLCE